MRRIIVLAVLATLTACGGSDYTPADRAADLLDRQRAILALEDRATPADVAEWGRNWPEILRLEPVPTYCGTREAQGDAYVACALEWQELTGPWNH